MMIMIMFPDLRHFMRLSISVIEIVYLFGSILSREHLLNQNACSVDFLVFISFFHVAMHFASRGRDLSGLAIVHTYAIRTLH